MCDTGYSVKRLVDDLRDLRDRGGPEPAMLEEASELVKRLVLMKHNWLRGYMGAPGEGNAVGIHKLHEEPDHTLAVFVIARPAGDETPAHDHRTWAVIAGLQGREMQRWWTRRDDGSIAQGDEEPIEPGVIIAMGADAIHSVRNDSSDTAVTLHVYGVDPEYTGRRDDDTGRSASAPDRAGQGA
jgi:predicted metal-dependent enzyme (double-stranded beta helix superfamily)